jgi:hypothetical protein
MTRLSFAAGICAVVAVGGCATTSPFTQYYTSFISGPVARDSTLVPFVGDPAVFGGSPDRDADSRKMWEDGYRDIGASSFYGPLQSADLAKARAKELQAAAVVLYGNNPRMVSQQVPVLDLSGVANVLSPPTTTSQTSGTIYGTSGALNYNQTTTTTAVPAPKPPAFEQVNYVQYDQIAVFWAKAKPRRLGVLFRDLTDDQRQTLGGNKGLVVEAVTKGSPAFLGDVLRGDIMTSIDGEPIRQQLDVSTILSGRAGKDVAIHVLRGTKDKVLRVHLGD